MNNLPDTQYSLLARLSDPQDREAWEQFIDIYRPVIYRLARGKGLQDADAQDLAQQVLISVSAAIPDWQRTSDHTRFRHWLKKVVRNAALNALTRGQGKHLLGGTSLLNAVSEEGNLHAELEQQIDAEHRREVFRKASTIVQQQVQAATWQAFQLSAIQNLSVEKVAAETGLSIGAVYIARSRVLSRLRQTVEAIEKELQS